MSLLDVDPALAQALSDRGYASLTAVQAAVLEPQARGRDLLVSARTGSGKTVAFGLALAETLLGEGGALPAPGAPKALVIAPTRELAIQVQRELQWLYANARVAACVGGMDPRAERRALDAGCHIVVGTPGRLRDHLERGALRLEHLGAAVLDEADEMLDLGFREELEEILDATPTGRRTLLFSATLPKPIIALAATYQRDALRLVVGAAEEPHADIDYRAMSIAPAEVELATVNILRYFDPDAALIFCSTREAVRRLHANLVERGFNIVALSGEMSQNERSHALQALRDRRSRVCVATDVAARGIDIPDLDLVIHADLPVNRDVLQHRSGRTGRAGRKGVCIVLAPHPKRRRAQALIDAAKINVTWQSPPSAEDIRAQDQARLIEQVGDAASASEDDLAQARALMERRSAEDIAAAYVRLARSRLPAPEDLASSEPEPAPYTPRAPEAPRPGFEDAAWYSINLGRSRNAEARWLLPMICRRGHVTKREIGAIRVFQHESRFQIVADAVDGFEAVLPKTEADGGRIVRIAADAPLPKDERPKDRGPRPPRRDKDKASFVREEFASAEAPDRPARTYPAQDRSDADRAPRDRPAKFDKKPWSPPIDGAERPPAKPHKPPHAKGAPFKGPPKGKKKRKPNG
ncbi:MAG TPA: DEAD/DEAH box helicase [Caulobacteraceae bacterium]|nr:DEAD/DEAH box helicase [Caulobacteraceae bacterium]